MTFGRIILAESDSKMRTLLYDLLTSAGFFVTSVMPNALNIDMLDRSSADAVLAGVSSGEKYCMELLARMNGICDIPFTVMVSEEERGDRLKYLAFGADEVFVKPVDANEVALKLRSILRRDYNSSLKKTSNPLSATCGLSVDMYSYTVSINGKTFAMPPKELEILHLLMSNPERVFRRAEIAAHVWGQNLDNERTIDSHIARIKRIIKKPCADYIKSVRGVGYKFTNLRSESLSAEEIIMA